MKDLTPEQKNTVLFSETQGLSRTLLLAVAGGEVLIFSAVLVSLVSSGKIGGNELGVAALAFLVAGGVLALLLSLRMQTVVSRRELHIKFAPFLNRRLPLSEIQEFQARTYKPISEYGGWGLRWGPSGTAYNAQGNNGVQLVLANGKRLLIGSQRAAELEAAIRSARKDA